MCIWAGKGREEGRGGGGGQYPAIHSFLLGPWAREGGGTGSKRDWGVGGGGAGEWQPLCGNLGLGLTSIRYLLGPGIRGGLSHSQPWS